MYKDENVSQSRCTADHSRTLDSSKTECTPYENLKLEVNAPLQLHQLEHVLYSTSVSNSSKFVERHDINHLQFIQKVRLLIGK